MHEKTRGKKETGYVKGEKKRKGERRSSSVRFLIEFFFVCVCVLFCGPTVGSRVSLSTGYTLFLVTPLLVVPQRLRSAGELPGSALSLEQSKANEQTRGTPTS